MRYFICLFFVLIICSPLSGYAVLTKDENGVIIHRQPNLSPDIDTRRLRFTGYTHADNVIRYSEEAIIEASKSKEHKKNKSMRKDKELDIDVVYAEVIKFNSDKSNYNGKIAYIVKGVDGRWYIKYQKITVRTQFIYDKKNLTVQQLQQQLRNYQGLSRIGAGGVVYNQASGAGFHAGYYRSHGASEYYQHCQDRVDGGCRLVEREELIWATVPLDSEGVVWREGHYELVIRGDVNSSYQVIERAGFY